MKNVFVAGGGVGLNSLISGEIQNLAGAAVMSTTSAATEYQIVRPTGNAVTVGATAWFVSETALGTGGGAAGDLLANLEIKTTAATNAAVFLEDGAGSAVVAVASVSGTSGTAPILNDVVFALTATSAITLTANQLANYVLKVTYIPTGGAAMIIYRKIVSHAAVSAATAVSFTVPNIIPAGAAPTAWEVRPLACYEVQPFNAPVGVVSIPINRRSTNGRWRVSIDSTVQVVANGLFT
jgi:hypothetical protein